MDAAKREAIQVAAAHLADLCDNIGFNPNTATTVLSDLQPALDDLASAIRQADVVNPTDHDALNSAEG